MRRSEFAMLLVDAVVLRPRAGRAQQPATPVVGLLDSSSAAVWPFVTAFRTSLTEAGFVEGRNVRIEYRWADGHYDRLLPYSQVSEASNMALERASGRYASTSRFTPLT